VPAEAAVQPRGDERARDDREGEAQGVAGAGRHEQEHRV
jgi:hypothetical protein